MKKIITFTMFISFFISCNLFNSNDNNAAKDNNIPILQILFTIKTSDSTYLLTDKIDEIKISVDSINWGTYSSEVIDLNSFKNIIKVNNFLSTKSKISYVVITDYMNIKNHPEFSKASDYSDFLNCANILEQGSHFCRIQEFRANGIYIKPHIIQNFTVNSISKNIYIGEILIDLTNL